MGLVIFAAVVAPRVVLGVMWYSGSRVDDAFNGWFVPLLGLIFLPYATIMYVLLWSANDGVRGSQWILVGIAAAVDVILTGSRLVPKKCPKRRGGVAGKGLPPVQDPCYAVCRHLHSTCELRGAQTECLQSGRRLRVSKAPLAARGALL